MRKHIIVLLVLLIAVSCFSIADAATLEQYSSIEKSTFEETKPEITKITSTKQGVKISFKGSDNTQYYYIYRSTGSNSSSWTKIGTVDTDTTGNKYFYDTTAIKGKTYKYKIRAQMRYSWMDNDTKGYLSAYSKVKSVKSKYLSAPAITSIKADEDGFKIKWKKISGTTKYQIYRSSEKDGDYKLIKTVSGSKTSYTDYSINQDKSQKYYYKMRIIKDGVKSSLSTYATAYTYAYEPKSEIPSVFCYIDETGTQFISWNKISEATGYEFTISGEKLTTLVDVGGNTNNIEILFADGLYYVSVRAKYTHNGITKYSDYSPKVAISVGDVSRPSIFKLETSILTNSLVELTWNLQGAKEFTVYKSIDDITYSPLVALKGSVMSYLADIIAGEATSFRVEATYPDGMIVKSNRAGVLTLPDNKNEETKKDDDTSAIQQDNTELEAKRIERINAIYDPQIAEAKARVEELLLSAGPTTMSVKEAELRIAGLDREIDYLTKTINTTKYPVSTLLSADLEKREKLKAEREQCMYELNKARANVELIKAQDALDVILKEKEAMIADKTQLFFH